jgi:biotin carboxyl carrier protein
MAANDLELVRHALKVARESGYGELELTSNGVSFTAKLEPRKRSATTSVGPDASSEPSLSPIRATQVGFYRPAPKPITPGSQIRKGDVVASIAALGLANDIESPFSGEVVEVFVQPDQAVEYGQVLATVRPTS